MRNADSQSSRFRLSVAVLVVLSMMVGLVGFGGPAAAEENDGVKFGASVGPSRLAGLAETEALLGRKLDLVRVFEKWESHSTKAYWQEVVGGGRTMLISVRPKRSNGSQISWRQIADAQPGSALHNDMVAWAQSMKDLGGDIWFTFQHEPEINENVGHGNSADFKAAWRKFVQVMRNNGANVEFAWILSSWAFEVNSGDRRSAAKWYPGDDVVDFIGADPYNWSNCREYDPAVNKSMAQITESFRKFGLSHPNKGLLLGEWGSTDFRNSGTKAQWITDVRNLFKTDAWSQLVAVAYYNAHDPKFPRCTWEIDSSPSALAALKDMGSDPFYNPGYSSSGGDQPIPKSSPGPQVGPRRSLMTGRVNSTNNPNPRWKSTSYKATVSGEHVFKLWHSGGTLDADVRTQNGDWLGVVGPDKVTTVTLTAGQTYQVAVWAKAGEGLFEMNVYAPKT